MGPVSMGWYRDRGLTRREERIATDNTMFYSIGETYTLECITEQYSSGRIDVSNGDELWVPPMKSADWYDFSQWLRDVETIVVWDLENLEVAYNHRHQQPIRWA
jgi:hypothetical protein